MATPRKPQPQTQTWSQPRERTQAAPQAATPPPDKIATRAYEIWQESGRPQGKDQENWFKAERELRGSRGGPSR